MDWCLDLNWHQLYHNYHIIQFRIDQTNTIGQPALLQVPL